MVGWHHQLNGHEFVQTQGEIEGQGSLPCCSPCSHKESDMTQLMTNNIYTEVFEIKYHDVFALLVDSLTKWNCVCVFYKEIYEASLIICSSYIKVKEYMFPLYCSFFFLAVLGLHCFMWAFSSCGKQGLLFIFMWVSHCSGLPCSEHRLQVCKLHSCSTWAQQLWLLGSKAQGQLQSTG